MSSGDHINHQQLALFMPAGELRQNIPNDFIPDVDWGPSSVDEMWANKLDTAKMKDYNEESERSLYDRIASGGVERPVRIHVDDGTIIDGHHRIASAADIDPKMEVPVENVGSRKDRGLKTSLRHHIVQ